MQKCLWCENELPSGSTEALCPDCNRVATGVPGVSGFQLDTMPFGIIEVNRSGRVIAYNKAEEELSGLSRIDVVGRNFFTEIARCADVQDFRGRLEAFLDGDDLSERFDYTFPFERGAVDVQITFLRVNREVALVLTKRTTHEHM